MRFWIKFDWNPAIKPFDITIQEVNIE